MPATPKPASKPAKDPISALFKLLKSLVEPTPHSGDDEAAQSELRAEAADRVQVTPVSFSANSRAALSILALRAQVNALAPARSKASDGILGDDNHAKRSSDHNPWVKDGSTGVVTAIDITHDPARGCDALLLAQSLVDSRDPRIKYIIHDRRIASSIPTQGLPAWTWRPYGGSNPHRAHVHLSVQPVKALYDDTRAWDLRGMAGGTRARPKPAAVAAAIASPPLAKIAPAAGDPIAWGRRVSAEFKAAVLAMARRLDTDPNVLMAVMAFETGRSFDPAQRNMAGSGAVGLIQFMPSTARGLGTTTADLARMSAVEQLVFVERHLRPFAGRMTDVASAYMAVLLPSAVRQPLSFVLFQAPSRAYSQNRGLDIDDDGKITKAEAARKVQTMLVEGMRPENFG